MKHDSAIILLGWKYLGVWVFYLLFCMKKKKEEEEEEEEENKNKNNNNKKKTYPITETARFDAYVKQ